MFSSFFGAPAPAPEPSPTKADLEEAARKAARRKAAAEARKKREAAEAQAAAADGDAANVPQVLPDAFSVKKREKKRQDSSGLGAIREDGVSLGRATPPAAPLAPKEPQVIPQTAAELAKFAARAAAAQEEAVADLMRQAKDQYAEDLANEVRKAVEETEERVRAECAETLAQVRRRGDPRT